MLGGYPRLVSQMQSARNWMRLWLNAYTRAKAERICLSSYHLARILRFSRFEAAINSSHSVRVSKLANISRIERIVFELFSLTTSHLFFILFTFFNCLFDYNTGCQILLSDRNIIPSTLKPITRPQLMILNQIKRPNIIIKISTIKGFSPICVR